MASFRFWAMNAVIIVLAFTMGKWTGNTTNMDGNDNTPCTTRGLTLSSGSTTSAIRLSAGKRSRSAPAKALVLSSVGDEIVWTLQRLPDFCTLPYARDSATDRAFVALPNRGKEAGVYLRFIVDHYDNLPDRTVFLHGHGDGGWHQGHLVPILRHLNYSLDFAAVNWFDDYSMGWGTIENSEGAGGREYWEVMNATWTTLFEPAFGIPMPDRITCPKSAQFMVSRERVRRFPLAWYQSALRWIETQTLFEEQIWAGFVFEYFWPMAFADEGLGIWGYSPAPTQEEEICRVLTDCPGGTDFDAIKGDVSIPGTEQELNALRGGYPCGPWG